MRCIIDSSTRINALHITYSSLLRIGKLLLISSSDQKCYGSTTSSSSRASSILILTSAIYFVISSISCGTIWEYCGEPPWIAAIASSSAVRPLGWINLHRVLLCCPEWRSASSLSLSWYTGKLFLRPSTRISCAQIQKAILVQGSTRKMHADLEMRQLCRTRSQESQSYNSMEGLLSPNHLFISGYIPRVCQ